MTNIEVIVKEAAPRDVGRGIIRLDPQVAEKLNISTGQALQILGRRRTAAIHWPGYAEDRGTGIALDTAASQSISNNVCNGNNFVGIFITGEETTTSIVNNTCNNNKYGIYRYKDSNIAIDKNKNSALKNSKGNFLLN